MIEIKKIIKKRSINEISLFNPCPNGIDSLSGQNAREN